MIVTRLSVLTSLLSLLLTGNAFTVVAPSGKALRVRSPSTWIGSSAEAADGGSAEPQGEEAAPVEETSDSSTGDDILNSPAFLKRKLDVLKSDLEAADQELATEQARFEEGKAEWGSQFDELSKEYKNIQERMNTQSGKGDEMATVQVARQMLEVLDNFDRAFGAVSAETPEQQAIETEYKKAYDMIIDTFKELGVEQIETVGIEFDYEYHQAVMQKPDDNFESGICCEEFGKGFKFGDTLIRAAMVAVAA